MDQSYVTDVFTRHIPVWTPLFAELAGNPNVHGLEIGSFEGRSACWLLQNVLTDPTSKLTCIDLFTPFHFFPAPGAEAFEPVHLDIGAQFDTNIRATGAEDRVQKLKGDSNMLLRSLPVHHYDFIYIDGSHEPRDVLQDAVLCWPLLKTGGILIFDDYGLQEPNFPEREPKTAIDFFLRTFDFDFTLLHKDYQVIIRKTRHHDPTKTELFSVPLMHPPR